MAKRFTRNVINIKDIKKVDEITTNLNDLLQDENGKVYVHTINGYVDITRQTNSVVSGDSDDEVIDVSTDDEGNVTIKTNGNIVTKITSTDDIVKVVQNKHSVEIQPNSNIPVNLKSSDESLIIDNSDNSHDYDLKVDTSKLPTKNPITLNGDIDSNNVTLKLGTNVPLSGISMTGDAIKTFNMGLLPDGQFMLNSTNNTNKNSLHLSTTSISFTSENDHFSIDILSSDKVEVKMSDNVKNAFRKALGID